MRRGLNEGSFVVWPSPRAAPCLNSTYTHTHTHTPTHRARQAFHKAPGERACALLIHVPGWEGLTGTRDGGGQRAGVPLALAALAACQAILLERGPGTRQPRPPGTLEISGIYGIYKIWDMWNDGAWECRGGCELGNYSGVRRGADENGVLYEQTAPATAATHQSGSKSTRDRFGPGIGQRGNCQNFLLEQAANGTSNQTN